MDKQKLFIDKHNKMEEMKVFIFNQIIIYIFKSDTLMWPKQNIYTVREMERERGKKISI